MVLRIVYAMILFLCPFWGSAQETIAVSEITPGMQGHGLSVFQGSKIEKFNVQVVAVLYGVLPRQDLILVRCTRYYDHFDLDRSGLIAGMSGSPVYLQGKLAGAVAYGWSFAKQTLAGVTPIADMLKETKRPLENPIAWRDGAVPAPPGLSQEGSLQAIQSPLLMSGFSPRAFALAKTLFAEQGFLPVQGGGNAGVVPQAEIALEPGSAIGGQLMRGDLNMVGIGTVTWTQGNEVLAFGHPFFGAGEIDLPITTAYISSIIESQAVSFKLGHAVKPVGSLRQDRQACIYGRLGQSSAMVPMTVQIRNKTTGYRETFSVEVMQHSFFTPRLLAIALVNFLDAQEATLGDNTARCRLRAHFHNSPTPLEIADLSASATMIFPSILNSLSQLLSNPFESAPLKKIEVEVEVAHRLEVALIESVSVSQTEVEAGKEIQIYVQLKPYGKPSYVEKMTFCFPANTPAGLQQLFIAGGKLLKPPIVSPENFEQYRQALEKLNRFENNCLLVAFPTPELEVIYREHRLSRLPVSILGNLLQTSATRDIRLLPKDVYLDRVTPYIIEGASTIFVIVKEKKAE